LHQLFARVGSLPVFRRGRNVGAVRAALRRLEQGEIVGIFPEGEVTGRDDRIASCKLGAAYLALKSGAPVYPAWITGGPRSARVIRDWLWPSQQVQVCVGSPVDLSAYRGRQITHRLLTEVTAVIMRHIEQLASVPARDEPQPSEQPAFSLAPVAR
jgi:1-acyl-sn-glycerol-3-phosphate acyltransferase